MGRSKVVCKRVTMHGTIGVIAMLDDGTSREVLLSPGRLMRSCPVSVASAQLRKETAMRETYQIKSRFNGVLPQRLRDQARWLESRSFAILHGDIEREAADEIERLRAEQRPDCEWTCDDGHYDTACGHGWYFVDGDVEENNAVYCPFCGGKIVGAGQ